MTTYFEIPTRAFTDEREYVLLGQVPPGQYVAHMSGTLAWSEPSEGGQVRHCATLKVFGFVNGEPTNWKSGLKLRLVTSYGSVPLDGVEPGQRSHAFSVTRVIDIPEEIEDLRLMVVDQGPSTTNVVLKVAWVILQ